MNASPVHRHVPGSIVVGYDGSGLSRAALGWAADRAASRGVPLHIVHAFAPDIPSLAFGSLTGIDEVTAQGELLLDQAVAAATSRHPGLPIVRTLAGGYASPALIAAAHDAGMIVVGTTGGSALKLNPVGAVARHIAAYAPCPVALIGHEDTHDEGPVVVGWEDSPNSNHALKVAIQVAATWQRPLVVVHAWEPKSRRDPTLTAGSSWDEYVDTQESAIRRAVELVGGAGTVEVIPEIVQADPVKELRDRSRTAPLVIVGARGAGGFDGLRLGSTTTRLLGQTASPLLITRRRRVTDPY